MNRLIFLGSGGGRTVMFTQARHTGGIYLELSGKKFVIDPGPGSLLNARNLRLKIDDLDAILLSHRHVDHSTDVNAYIDGIDGVALIAEKTSIEGDDDFPVVTKYHQKKAKYVIPAVEEQEFAIGDVKIRTTKAVHTSPTIGFVIEGEKKIGYTADTIYYDDMEKYYDGVDVFIANVLVPYKKTPHLLKHFSVDDVIKVINKMERKPKMAVITHLSMWMLRNNPSEQARIIQKSTGVKTIAARDNLEINLSSFGENEKLDKFMK